MHVDRSIAEFTYVNSPLNVFRRRERSSPTRIDISDDKIARAKVSIYQMHYHKGRARRREVGEFLKNESRQISFRLEGWWHVGRIERRSLVPVRFR